MQQRYQILYLTHYSTAKPDGLQVVLGTNGKADQTLTSLIRCKTSAEATGNTEIICS